MKRLISTLALMLTCASAFSAWVDDEGWSCRLQARGLPVTLECLPPQNNPALPTSIGSGYCPESDSHWVNTGVTDWEDLHRQGPTYPNDETVFVLYDSTTFCSTDCQGRYDVIEARVGRWRTPMADWEWGGPTLGKMPRYFFGNAFRISVRPDWDHSQWSWQSVYMMDLIRNNMGSYARDYVCPNRPSSVTLFSGFTPDFVDVVQASAGSIMPFMMCDNSVDHDFADDPDPTWWTGNFTVCTGDFIGFVGSATPSSTSMAYADLWMIDSNDSGTAYTVGGETELWTRVDVVSGVPTPVNIYNNGSSSAMMLSATESAKLTPVKVKDVPPGLRKKVWDRYYQLQGR